MRHSARFPVVLLALFTLACDGEDPPADGGPRPDGGPDSDAGFDCAAEELFEGEVSEGLIVGERVGEDFVSYDDDPVVTYVWGFQGGTMIVPVIGVPVALAGDETCVQVRVTHRVDPAFPDESISTTDFPGFTRGLTGTVEGDVLWLEPLEDQIGWEAVDGKHLLLEVEVTGRGFAARYSVALTLESSEPEVCRALERTGTGCVYYLVPGTVTVTAIEPSDEVDTGCIDPQRVQATFTPTDPAAEACYMVSPEYYNTELRVTEYGPHPPASCLSSIVVGSVVPATLYASFVGTCSPRYYGFELPGCAADCGM